MTQIETKNTRNIQELLNRASSDKNAAIELLKSFRFSMLNEARLYLDEENARDVVLSVFRDVYSKLEDTDALHIELWLNEHVQKECMNRILPLEKAVDAPYTASDEKANTSLSFPYDTAEIRKMLRSVLKILSPSRRLVSVMKYRDQLSFEEIADRCSVNEKDIKNLVSAAKEQLKNANADLSTIFTMVNKLYPGLEEFGDETPDLPVLKHKTREELEEEEFNTAVQELKILFDTKTVPISRIADRDIDDSEEPEPENIEDTFEMKSIRQMGSGDVDDTVSSAKMIMAAAMSADPADKVSEKEYNPKSYWIKRAIIVGVIAILAFGIGVVFSMIRSNIDKNSSDAQKTAETETVAPEETDTPVPTEEATPEPTEEAIPETTDDGSIGEITILVTDLSIRSGPGVSYAQVGIAVPDQAYTVYESSEADGYTWYKVGEDQWIPDLDGQYATYTPKS